MDNQYAKQVLKEFVKRDRMLRENSVKSDYDKFCETTCRAIEIILAENKELKAKYDRTLSNLVKAEKEKNQIKEEKEHYQGLFIVTKENSISRDKIKKKKLELKAINFDTADDRDYIIRILDELIGEENRVCEYCNKKVRNKKFQDIDNDKEDSMSIVFLDRVYLEVELDAIDEDGYKALDYFEINYCPKCGKKVRR